MYLTQLLTNPLFTKAKQHLEIEPGSNGRRSGRRLHESTSYLRLDKCSKGLPLITQINNSNELLNDKNTGLQTFIMRSNELNTAMGNTTQQTKSMDSTTKEIDRINPSTFAKSYMETQCRLSELELIFQVSIPFIRRKNIIKYLSAYIYIYIDDSRFRVLESLRIFWLNLLLCSNYFQDLS